MRFPINAETLKRKVGPLPVWAWALIIVGVGYVAYRTLRGNAAPVDTSTIDPYSLDNTNVGTNPLDTGGSFGGGGGGSTFPTLPDLYQGGATNSGFDPSLIDSYLSSLFDGGYDPGLAPGFGGDILGNTPVGDSTSPVVVTAPKAAAGSVNTQKVNERLQLAEQAAASGNLAAAVNYARAALPYSKSDTSTANVKSIIASYETALNASHTSGGTPAPTQPAATPAPAPAPTSNSGSGSVNTQKVNERLNLAAQAAAQGNYAAAVNYAKAALGYSKSAASDANINSIIAAYSARL